MSEIGIRGIDLFKIANESISGWIPSWKMGGQKPTRQPFCSLMEERLLLYLEYHPQVVWYGRGDISPTFASTYKITTPLTTPFAINYLFDGNAHVYLPDAIGQLEDGSLLIRGKYRVLALAASALRGIRTRLKQHGFRDVTFA